MSDPVIRTIQAIDAIEERLLERIDQLFDIIEDKILEKLDE